MRRQARALGLTSINIKHVVFLGGGEGGEGINLCILIRLISRSFRLVLYLN